MKVLWIEVTVPGRYKESGRVSEGWQDSLELIVRDCPDLELYIAFEAPVGSEQKTIDGVGYFPIVVKESFFKKWKNRWSCREHTESLINGVLDVIERVQPDVIHIFGTEWLWGLVAKRTDIPVVIHIQGALQPYYNALFPPRYNHIDCIKNIFPNPKKLINYILDSHRFQTSVHMEREVWNAVNYYMGRTDWDHALLGSLNSNAEYFHVEEALRPQFLNSDRLWTYQEGKKIKLFSTGCGSFWKGPDMLLKTAHILTEMGLDFEWKVAGGITQDTIRLIEKKECLSFRNSNVEFIGFTKADDLFELLCSSTMYVHTAYIENSPNSICEAQILGLPIVSTNVGGISSLVGDNGVLVPANDPWQMASAIAELTKDKERMIEYSRRGRDLARNRHESENIKKQLLNCYNSIINY